MAVLIGSCAFTYRIGDDIGRSINDLDFVGTYDEVEAYRKKLRPKVCYPFNKGRKVFMKDAKGGITEAEVAWEGSVEEKLVNFVMADEGTTYSNLLEFYIPSLNVLYMLKMSHRYLKDSPHFLKTMRDIQLMRKMGAVIQPEHEAFYKERMKDTYVYTHPKLDVGKGEFFDNVMTGVPQVYCHDSIHEAVKHLDKPAYEYFKPVASEVLCDKEMFFAEEEIVRLYAVLEEAYVLALERSLVPFPGKKTPKEAFDMALMKVCTSITSGWFREFAYENYDKVQALYSDEYVDAFNRGVANGTVKEN